MKTTIVWITILLTLVIAAARAVTPLRVDGPSASDAAILSALEQAIEAMENDGVDIKTTSNKEGDNECSSLDGPFCSIINYDMYGITENPYSSGEVGANMFNSNIRTSLDKILSALKIKPQSSTGSNNNIENSRTRRKKPTVITATISADATPEEIAEATRAALRKAGITDVDNIDSITTAGAAGSSAGEIAAATRRAIEESGFFDDVDVNNVGAVGGDYMDTNDLNSLISEARQLIMDENGDLRDIENLENLEQLIDQATQGRGTRGNVNNNGNHNDDPVETMSKPVTPQKRLADDLASNDYTSPSPLHEPRDEEILRLDLMDDVHAVQSSVFLNREAKLAIDGNTDGNWPDISHTYNQKEAWWQVTLPHVYPISSIRVWNRRDGGANIRQRLFPFFLLISNANAFSDAQCPNPSSCNSLQNAIKVALDYKYFKSSSSCRVEEGKIDGREMCIWEFEVPINLQHVRVQLEESSHLNLAEVELLISPSASDQHDDGGGDDAALEYEESEQMMEILSNGEHVGMDVDMNGDDEEVEL